MASVLAIDLEAMALRVGGEEKAKPVLNLGLVRDAVREIQDHMLHVRDKLLEPPPRCIRCQKAPGGVDGLCPQCEEELRP